MRSSPLCLGLLHHDNASGAIYHSYSRAFNECMLLAHGHCGSTDLAGEKALIVNSAMAAGFSYPQRGNAEI